MSINPRRSEQEHKFCSVRAIIQLRAAPLKLTSMGFPHLGNSECPQGYGTTAQCPDPRDSDSAGLGQPGNLVCNTFPGDADAAGLGPQRGKAMESGISVHRALPHFLTLGRQLTHRCLFALLNEEGNGFRSGRLVTSYVRRGDRKCPHGSGCRI